MNLAQTTDDDTNVTIMYRNFWNTINFRTPQCLDVWDIQLCNSIWSVGNMNENWLIFCSSVISLIFKYKYIYVTKCTLLMFLPMHQPATKNQKLNLYCFDFYWCRNSKREEDRLTLLFSTATTTEFFFLEIRIWFLVTGWCTGSFDRFWYTLKTSGTIWK